MLIDAKLGDLRGVLGTKKDTLVTKGVASVSSPVRNLREWSSSIGHEQFVETVSQEFARYYANDQEIDVKVSMRKFRVGSSAQDADMAR